MSMEPKKEVFDESTQENDANLNVKTDLKSGTGGDGSYVGENLASGAGSGGSLPPPTTPPRGN